MPSAQDYLNAAFAKIRNLEEERDKLAGKIDLLQASVASLTAARKDVQTFREKIVAESQLVLPKWYPVNFTVPAASTAQQNASVTVTQEGWFFIDRIYATWRETTNNHFRAISSGGLASMTTVATLENEIDFTWSYQDGRTGLRRMETEIPGDILFRGDLDGVIPGGGAGDAIGPNTPIQVTITPTRQTGIAGILTFVFVGVQCLKIIKA